jgi:hypothetical protein
VSAEVTISKSEVQRSFLLTVFNGAVFNFAKRLIDPPLVLTWFVSRLTSSNFLIGLVTPLGNSGWFLPQIFISARIQRMQRKMPNYTAAAVARVFCWLLLVAALWLLDDPVLLLASFFVLYTVASLGAGLAGLTFFDVLAKTIPAWRRGSLFAWRQFLGGGLALGAGWIVKTVLNHSALPFPRGHAFLFALYCVLIAPAMGAFIAVREPAGGTIAELVTVGEQLRRARQLLVEDHVYRRYIAAQLSLTMAIIALPFYGVYARNVLGAPEGMVGVYVTTRVVSQLLFNLPWGSVSDRHGNRLVMRLLSLGKGLAALLALALVAAVGLLHPQGAWLPYSVLPLFFLEGATWPAHVLTGSNFLLELVSEAERPLYLGLSNTLKGMALMISAMGGLLVDLFGFAGPFALSLGLCVAGYVLTMGLPEPRSK